MERLSRRAFLASAGAMGIAGWSAPARSLTLFPDRKTRLSPQEFKQRVRGPILTLPTPFTRDFAIDEESIRRMVHLGLANGAGVFELTAGNSLYSTLSYEEVKRLTRVFVEAVNGRGVVIAATGDWWTGQAVDYARYAESVGADAVQILVPSCTPDRYVQHIRAISDSTRLALVLQGDPSVAILQRLVELPSVVSMKEDGGEDYYEDIMKRFGSRLAIFCGGQKRRYLRGFPLGSPAFFSFFITFAPQVTTQFWEALQSNDMKTAREVAERYETPVFDHCLKGPRPFTACWRGLLEIFGTGQRWMRSPTESCTDEDIKELRALCHRLGLEPPMGTRTQNLPKSNAEWRALALSTLNTALKNDPIKRMHAAEVLIWNGYVEEPKTLYMPRLSETQGVERIAGWRVLAQAEKGEARRRYVEQVRDAALDAQSPFAEFSIESLGKLGYGGQEARFVELARAGTPVMQILARWVLANSGQERDEAYLTELLTLPEPRMRGVTAYALRFLKRLRPATLQKLREGAAKEPRNSEGRVFFLTTLYVHDPAADRKALKEGLMQYAATGTPEERYQALLIVGKHANAADFPRLYPLLSAVDTDVRIAAAHAILTVLGPK